MNFDFSDEQYALRDEARRFLAERCPQSVVRAAADPHAPEASKLWGEMAALGWTALAFDEEHGGLGRGFLDVFLLLGEIGYALAPVPFLSSVVLYGHTVLAHGTAEQQARLLPGVAAGERAGAMAHAEPGGAFEESSVQARAEPNGGAWRLRGTKRVVLDAPLASAFVVSARDPAGALAWYVCDDGYAVTTRRGFDVVRSVGDVAFDGAPAERLGAVEGLGAGLTFAVAAVCAEMVGAAQAVLDRTVAYAKVREQFGRPIGSFQAIKHKCAEMATELEAARSAAMYAAWAAASGAPDAALAASVAKSYCSESLAHLAGEGVQAHGGIAFTWEHDMHLYLKRLKSLEPAFGDAAFHRERIAVLAGL